MIRTAARQAALSWVVLLAACAAGGPGGRVGDSPAVALAKLVARPELLGGRIGVLVVDSATGEVLAENDANRGFATASNMKLVSSAVALSALGGQARTRTELLLRGDVRDGVLHGDVILRGHGDPTFAEEAWPGQPLVAFAQTLRQRGIARVTGRVLGDGSWQGEETLGLGWQWDYLDDDYAAPFGGLNCAGNLITVRVAPSANGLVVATATPTAVPPRFEVRQVAKGEPTVVRARRALGSEGVAVQGQIAADAKEQVMHLTVADPAIAAAVRLAAVLAEHGIVVEGGAGTFAPVGAAAELAVCTHASPDLAAILRPLLSNSNNLYAEQVWRWSARVATGDGSTQSSERHAKAVLQRLGVDTVGMVLADGSGLSRRNLVQPRQLVALLTAMLASPQAEVFAAGLPVAGESGTLRRRLQSGPAHGHVRAKTGYISRVVCLSGYVDRPDGQRPLVFSVMLNDFTCDDHEAKAAVDAFVQQLAAFAGWSTVG